MKLKEFGPISNELATSLFNGSTMSTLRSVAKSIKPDLIHDMTKQMFLISLIKYTASRDLELLLNDYGVEKVVSEWDNYITENVDDLIEATYAELSILQQKLEFILIKFQPDEDTKESK